MTEINNINMIKTAVSYKKRFYILVILSLLIGQLYTHFYAQNYFEYKMRIKSINTAITDTYKSESNYLSTLLTNSIIKDNPDPKLRYNTQQKFYYISSTKDLRGEIRNNLQNEYSTFIKRKKELYGRILTDLKTSYDSKITTPIIQDVRNVLSAYEFTIMYEKNPKLNVSFSEPKSLHPRTLKFGVISIFLCILIFITSVIYSEIRKSLQD